MVASTYPKKKKKGKKLECLILNQVIDVIVVSEALWTWPSVVIAMSDSGAGLGHSMVPCSKDSLIR